MEVEVDPMPRFVNSPDMQKMAHPSQPVGEKPQTDQGSPVGKAAICSISSHKDSGAVLTVGVGLG